MKLFAIARFDFGRRLRQLSTWVYFALFATLAALWMAAAGGAFASARVGFGGDRIAIDGAHALAIGIGVLGFIGVTVIGSIAGRAVQQDFEHGTDHFFFTAPIARRDYFLGRLFGAIATLAVVFAGIAVGIAIGTHWPGIDSARLAPQWSWEFIARPYAFLLLPNILWLAGCFFVLAALSRQMAPVYIAGVVVLVGYMVALDLLGDMENKTLAALIDPSGVTAVDVLTRYWSVAQKNGEPIPLAGVLLWNRALWLAVGALVTAFGYRAFRMQALAAKGSRRADAAADQPDPNAAARAAPLPATPRDLQASAYRRMLPALARLHVGEILASPRFLAIVLAGVLLVIANTWTMGSLYGTNTQPLTYKILDVAGGLFGLFVLVVTAIYAGELVWRERDARMADITDSLPAPTWLPFFAKLAALAALQAVLLAVVMLCGIGVQLAKGYTGIDLPHYLFELFVLQLAGFLLIGALALFVHTLVDHKYVGHFAVLLAFLAVTQLPDFGFEDRLYRYASRPDIVYSDMNGYGHFLPAVLWFRLYWGAFAVLLLLASYALWARGRERGVRARLAAAAARWTPVPRAIAGAAAALFVATGGFIYYNTHVLNPYVTRHDADAQRAAYERDFRHLAGAPQPTVTAVDLAVDLVPAARSARIAGSMRLENRSAVPIVDLYVHYPRSARVHGFDFGVPARLAAARPEVMWHHYVLAEPLPPGGSLLLRFDLGYEARGFRNDGADRLVLGNGTFLNAGLAPELTPVPTFGYDPALELAGDRERSKQGLAPRPRMPDLDDAAQHAKSALTRDADWIDYRATVCTAADQLPVTSGYVASDRTEGGRRCVTYRMDTPMAAIYPFVSARYAQRRDVWNGPGGDVAIEIDYHPGARVQPRPDGRRRQGLARVLHRALRALPAPASCASSSSRASGAAAGWPRRFPTRCPFNEAIGFTARVDDRDPTDVDYPYFVTAHEVAHQWWAHQVVPANVQGAEFVTETPRRVLGADGAEAEVRRREDAAVPQVRARPLPRRARDRAEGRAAAAACRRRRLRALPEGGAGALRAAGRDRRGRDRRCARRLRRPLALPGAAVRDVARPRRRAARA